MTFTPWLAALIVSSVQPNGLPQNATVRLGLSPTRLGAVQIAISADNKRIITATQDGQARIFDAATGTLLDSRRLVERVERNIYGGNGGSLIGLSDDGSLALIFDGEDYSARSMRLVETATGKVRLKYPSSQGGNTWLASATLSSDAKKILVNEYGVGNPRHTIVDVESGKSSSFLEQANGGIFVAMNMMFFSPDNTKVLILDPNNVGGGNAVTATCYNADDGKKLWTEAVGMHPAFSADSKSLLMIGVDKTTGVRDAATGKELKAKLPDPKETTKQQVAGPKDYVLYPLLSGGALVWNLKAGEAVVKLPAGHRPVSVNRNVAFAKDGSFVATAFNGHLCRWNLPKGEKVFGDPNPPGSATTVSRLVYSPDGKKLFCLGEGDVPGVWDIAAKSWAGTPELEKPKPPTDTEQMNMFFGGVMNTQSVAFTAAGPRFLTGGYNTLMEVRDGVTGKPLVKLKDATKGQAVNEYHYGQLSADGATATIYTMNYTGNHSRMTFDTWDVAAGVRTNTTEFTIPNYASMATISPCGRFTMLGGKVMVVATGATLFNIVKNQQQQYYYYGGNTTFSPDGRLMATSQTEESLRGNVNSPGTIHIWDTVTGRDIRKIVSGANSNLIVFSPDNRLVAFGSHKGVKVFDLNNGKELVAYTIHDMRVPNYYEGMGSGAPLAFGPDGRTLATGHFDGTVTIWKVPAPAEQPLVKDEDLDKFWDTLATDPQADPRVPLYRLLDHPDTAMKLLAAKFVAPPPKPLDVDLSTVIRRMDAPAFSERQGAIKKLRELGPRIAPALQEAIRTTESVEVRARAEELLEQMKAGPKTFSNGPDLRAMRAIEALERIASPQAKKLLQGWAVHTTNIRIANEASLALVRIAAAGK